MKFLLYVLVAYIEIFLKFMHNIGRNDNAVFEKKIQKILGIIYFFKKASA